jgi:hypothetical protein
MFTRTNKQFANDITALMHYIRGFNDKKSGKKSGKNEPALMLN